MLTADVKEEVALEGVNDIFLYLHKCLCEIFKFEFMVVVDV